jgi:hypothetical protein
MWQKISFWNAEGKAAKLLITTMLTVTLLVEEKLSNKNK